jgi:ParB family transcriptional regulator, chromosome partitioning protein
MVLPLDDLSLLDAPLATEPGQGAGAPLQLPIELVDEDPNQPRTEFDAEALQQLADTIAERGVRQPISVRPHPASPGRWLVNFGARRLRASKLAGKLTIPAFVDETADTYDQVIENEQRQALQPLELALFVQRQQQAGVSLAEIGRRLGKSRPYMTYVCALVDAPDWLMAVYRRGLCRGIKELYDLRRLHEEHPAEVATWLEGRVSVSRGDLSVLRERLIPVAHAHTASEKSASSSLIVDSSNPITNNKRQVAAEASASAVQRSSFRSSDVPPSTRQEPQHEVALLAEYKGEQVRVWLGLPANQPGLAWVSDATQAETVGSRHLVSVTALYSLCLVDLQRVK